MAFFRLSIQKAIPENQTNHTHSWFITFVHVSYISVKITLGIFERPSEVDGASGNIEENLPAQIIHYILESLHIMFSLLLFD